MNINTNFKETPSIANTNSTLASIPIQGRNVKLLNYSSDMKQLDWSTFNPQINQCIVNVETPCTLKVHKTGDAYLLEKLETGDEDRLSSFEQEFVEADRLSCTNSITLTALPPQDLRSSVVKEFDQIDSSTISIFLREVVGDLMRSKISFKLTKEEINHASNIVYETQETIETRYGDELIKPEWHGYTSFQRVYWQDPDFLKLLTSPSAVKWLINNFDPNSEEFDLSSFLVYGLKDNVISYLATASPNWEAKPQSLMSCDCRTMESKIQQSFPPRRMDEENVILFNNALETVYQVFKEAIDKDISELNLDYYHCLNEADTEKLFNVIWKLCKKSAKIDNVRGLVIRSVQGKSSSSKQWWQLHDQSLDVMKHYNHLLEACNNDHAAALSYGLISHALDARHLLTIIYKNYWDVEMEREEMLPEVIRNGMTGILGAEVEFLVRARLKQILEILRINGVERNEIIEMINS